MNWISVEDRLPKNGDRVLVFPDYILCQYGTEEFGGDILGIENEFSYFSEYNDEDRKPDFPVTHWAPLPKPPNQ